MLASLVHEEIGIGPALQRRCSSHEEVLGVRKLWLG
jgi:hypothetical protein